MKIFWMFLAAVGPAVAQAPASPQTPEQPAAKSPEQRPPLKLKLDEEPTRGAPRITFGARDGKAEQRPANTLPELGGKTSQALERTPSQVVPKDETQGR